MRTTFAAALILATTGASCALPPASLDTLGTVTRSLAPPSWIWGSWSQRGTGDNRFEFRQDDMVMKTDDLSPPTSFKNSPIRQVATEQLFVVDNNGGRFSFKKVAASESEGRMEVTMNVALIGVTDTWLRDKTLAELESGK